MSVDPVRALAAEMPTTTASWNADDVILYHLGLGAGLGQATDATELAYTYERGLKVLPTFAVTPISKSLLGINDVDGIDIDFRKVLHGEQELIVHRPLPQQAEVVNTPRVSAVYDKGAAALILLEIETSDADGPLFTNKVSVFARGEGGFGGERGPGSTISAPPDREPDMVVESPTTDHQGLIYRLSGDKNPLHVDPTMAGAAGFERPILHGLCTYGIVAKAVADHALDGDVTAIGRYQARFAGVVYPGETIVTSMWIDDDRISISAAVSKRGDTVLAPAMIWKMH
jgi:acyl dehydratase